VIIDVTDDDTMIVYRNVLVLQEMSCEMKMHSSRQKFREIQQVCCYSLYQLVEFLSNHHLARFTRGKRLLSEHFEQHHDRLAIYPDINLLVRCDKHSRQHVQGIGEFVGAIGVQDDVYELGYHKKIQRAYKKHRISPVSYAPDS